MNSFPWTAKPLPISTKGKQSPLDIPEILELIFSFLDDFTIRFKVALVCRQWHLLNPRPHLREVTWYQGWDPFRKWKALHNLAQAGRFYYCSLNLGIPRYAPKSTLNEDVLSALARLESKYQKQLEQQSNRTDWCINPDSSSHSKQQASAILKPTGAVLDIQHLKEMHLYLSYVSWHNINSITFPSSLVRLSIKVGRANYARCCLSRILTGCPLLEDFCAEGEALSIIYGLNFTLMLDSKQPLFHVLRLRSLVLVQVAFLQTSLEKLLPHTPNLKELKLVAMLMAGEPCYNWIRLSDSLSANNIILGKAHFLTNGSGMSEVETEKLVQTVYSRLSSELSGAGCHSETPSVGSFPAKQLNSP
jgi:hypothetical protein